MSVQAVYLKDDFEDALIATAWVASASGSATVAETSGQARFTLPSSTAGTHTARYTSRVTYSLEGSPFYINIGTMVSTAVAATAFFQLYLNAANTFQWIQVSGTIYARKVVAGVSTDLYSAAWSGTTYRYLRISESAGTVTWWSSTNGTTWVSRITLVGLPFAITDLFIDFGATCGNVASPGSFRLDDVNLLLPVLTTAWNWTQVVWPFDERTETITAAIDVVGSVAGYVVTADEVDASDAPSGNVRYWAGPADAGRILTEQPTQAAAQAMAVYFPLDGRMDLESMVEGHCYRIYHRSVDGLSYILRELFPRRTIYADDIKAESILAIHIGVIDLDAQHRITAGLGAVRLDDNGVNILAVASSVDIYIPTTNKALTWSDPAANYIVYAQGAYDDTNLRNIIEVKARSIGGRTGMVRLAAEGSVIGNSAAIQLDTGGLGIVDLTARDIRVNLNNTGDTFRIKRTGITKLTITDTGAFQGLGTTNATAAIQAVNSAGLVNFQALDDGSIRTRTGNRWDLRGFVAGGGTITGHVDILLDGTLRRLAVI